MSEQNYPLSEEHFGHFIQPYERVVYKWYDIKAIVFDWDGVFNDAKKDVNGASNFSEVDSMGTNLLRLSYWLKNNEVPIMAIISGETNPLAKKLAEREHFHSIYSGVKNKVDAFRHLCKEHKLREEEVLYMFDDVLDFSIAEHCGLRIMVADHSKPQTMSYAIHNGLVDYLCRHSGGNGAVREMCELFITLNENVQETFDIRTEFRDTYQQYLQQRNAATLANYTVGDDGSMQLLQP